MSARELAAAVDESIRRPLTREDLTAAVDRLSKATDAMDAALPKSCYGEVLQGQMWDLHVATLALRRMVGLEPSPSGIAPELEL